MNNKLKARLDDPAVTPADMCESDKQPTAEIEIEDYPVFDLKRFGLECICARTEKQVGEATKLLVCYDARDGEIDEKVEALEGGPAQAAFKRACTAAGYPVILSSFSVEVDENEDGDEIMVEVEVDDRSAGGLGDPNSDQPTQRLPGVTEKPSAARQLRDF